MILATPGRPTLTGRCFFHTFNFFDHYQGITMSNLREFFDRFEHLNIRSDEQLDRLVGDARQIISGVGPQDLRDRGDLRQSISRELTRVEASLDGYLTDRPRRRILRRSR